MPFFSNRIVIMCSALPLRYPRSSFSFPVHSNSIQKLLASMLERYVLQSREVFERYLLLYSQQIYEVV